VARPGDLAEYFNTKRWQEAPVWDGVFNPLADGYVSVLVTYAGKVLKIYTNAVDRIPYVFSCRLAYLLSRWLGLIIIGALSSYVLYATFCLHCLTIGAGFMASIELNQRKGQQYEHNISFPVQQTTSIQFKMLN
jgi:hypothetical protein